MKLHEIQNTLNNLVLKPGVTLGNALSRDLSGTHNVIKELFMDNDKLTAEQYKKLMALRLSKKHSFDMPYSPSANVDDFIEDSENDELCAALIVPFSDRYHSVVLPIDKLIFSVRLDSSDSEYFVIQPNAETTKSGLFRLSMARSALIKRREHLTNTTGIQYRVAIFLDNPQL